jgi:hypothetical protein
VNSREGGVLGDSAERGLIEEKVEEKGVMGESKGTIEGEKGMSKGERSPTPFIQPFTTLSKDLPFVSFL